MKTLLLTGSLLAGLVGIATSAYAGPTTTFTGTYTVTQTSGKGNEPTITNDLSDPFTENLSLNTKTSAVNFITVTPQNTCGATCQPGFFSETASDTINVSFNFTVPGVGNGSDTAAFTATYNLFSDDTDSVTWHTSTTTVDFADGAVLNIYLNNASDWAITPTIQFMMTRAPNAVPEPMSLAALGTGLLALGFIRRQRRS